MERPIFSNCALQNTTLMVTTRVRRSHGARPRQHVFAFPGRYPGQSTSVRAVYGVCRARTSQPDEGGEAPTQSREGPDEGDPHDGAGAPSERQSGPVGAVREPAGRNRVV